MEMPDLIYAAHKIYPNDSGSEWMEQNGLGREIYHHDRIVESLRRENEELKAKLEKAKSSLEWYANKENHKHYGCVSDDGFNWSKAHIDEGDRARTTLEEIG